MQSQSEIRASIASELSDLRSELKLTKAKMAELLHMDPHKWAKYESGEITPHADEFILIFEKVKANYLRALLNVKYPDTYKRLIPKSDLKQLREAIAHYFLNIASELVVHEFVYLALGDHGSNLEPQMQEWTMIDHLPMEYRYIIAETIHMLYKLAESKNILINTDEIMPDISIFEDGKLKGHEAILHGLEKYTPANN